MYTQQNYHQLQMPLSYDMTSRNSCYTTPSKESTMMLSKHNYYQANVSPTSVNHHHQYHTNQSHYESPPFDHPTFTPSPPALIPPTFGFSHSLSPALSFQHCRDNEYIPAAIVKRRIQFIEQPSAFLSSPKNQTYSELIHRQRQDGSEQLSPPFMTEQFFRHILSKRRAETRDIATQTDNPPPSIPNKTPTISDRTPSSNTGTPLSSSDTTLTKPLVKRRIKRKLSSSSSSLKAKTAKKSIIHVNRKGDQEKKQTKAIRERKRVRNEANAFKILRSNLPPVDVDTLTGTPIYAKTYYEIMCTTIDYIKGLTEMIEEHDGKNQHL